MGIIATLVITVKVNDVETTEKVDRDFCSIAHLREYLCSYPVTTTSNGVTLTVTVECIEFIHESDLNLLADEASLERMGGVFDFDTYDDTRMK